MGACLSCGADEFGPGDYPAHGKKLRADATVEQVYELGRELGKGAYSKVRLATDWQTGEQWACKIMTLPRFDRSAIMQEIAVLLELDHPRVVALHEYYCQDAKVYLIMELLRGGELLDALLKQGHYSEASARTIFRQLIEALAYLHSRGVVHRDVKLKNLLLAAPDDINQVKLADFGFAVKARRGKMDALRTVCGTPGYVAPEVLLIDVQSDNVLPRLDLHYGPPCDLWSAGVCLFSLLCGVPPFAASNNDKLVAAVLAGHYSFSDPAWKEVSAEAKDLVRKLLVVDPAARLTCEQALAHPWMTLPCPDTPLQRTRSQLQDASQHGRSPRKSLQERINDAVDASVRSRSRSGSCRGGWHFLPSSPRGSRGGSLRAGTGAGAVLAGSRGGSLRAGSGAAAALAGGSLRAGMGAGTALAAGSRGGSLRAGTGAAAALAAPRRRSGSFKGGGGGGAGLPPEEVTLRAGVPLGGAPMTLADRLSPWPKPGGSRAKSIAE